MKRSILLQAAFMVAGIVACNAQYIPDTKATAARLKQHITILSSDQFEGREAGTNGEKLAFTYLITAFEEVGLTTLGEGSYLQRFPFTAKTVIGPGCMMKLNGKTLIVEKDFFPLAHSANAAVKGEVINAGYGIVAPTLDYDDYRGLDVKGHIVLMELSNPEGSNPHSKYAEFAGLRTKIETAAEKGATGVIFVNSDSETEDPKAEYMHKITPANIPVVFLARQKELIRKTGSNRAEFNMELNKISASGYNVIGFMDNKASATVVIGAHYDHLGYGDDGSLHRGEPAIHNGADDNASGTAALIELARILKQSGAKKNNYLFIAFSGEEKGLLGSNYFVKNPTLDLANVNYMINMDMVGRLKADERKLTVLGSGTSPVWKDLLERIQIDSVRIVDSESGVGPSDHTSFYLKDIPVLHFFTGSHPDYHKPSDDEDKINYQGQLSVMNIILGVIHGADSLGKFEFSKTKDSDSKSVPRFKVTLGVVPDYAFEGAGMRIDGVSDDKPASNAGLLAGDIVIQMGEHKVVDMMSYMRALSKFVKGDTAVVRFKRGDAEMEANVTF